MKNEELMRTRIGFDSYYSDLRNLKAMQHLDGIASDVEDPSEVEELLEQNSEWEEANIYSADEVWGVTWDLISQSKSEDEIQEWIDLDARWESTMTDCFLNIEEILVKRSIEEIEGGMN